MIVWDGDGYLISHEEECTCLLCEEQWAYEQEQEQAPFNEPSFIDCDCGCDCYACDCDCDCYDCQQSREELD